ncbi:MAG: putative sporulation protein YtxC [Firmicutes bacterium]|nr:putative sporulation protein YtxC [Bacillota bacterium]
MTALALIVIAVKHVTPGLKSELEECMLFFRKAGYEAALEEKQVGHWPHLLCRLGDVVQDAPARMSSNIFRRRLAESLAQYVVCEQATSYFNDMLTHYYFYFPKDEKQLILALAEKSYQADPSKDEGGQIYAEVLQSVKEYVENTDYVNLHGLIIFRMRLWLKFLRRTLDKAVDDFLMEKEYQEFVKLLKYFVALQEPKINQIHVALDDEGRFRLLDQEYQPIDPEQGIYWDNDEGISDEEDQLVSMLITAAPHSIVLHKHVYTQYPKAVDTLKHVFENRVTLCKRCKLCHDVGRNINLKGKI